MINTTFTESEQYLNGIEIHANGVFVGVLLRRGRENLSWYAGSEPTIVRFSLSDEKKFRQIINAIKQYFYNNNYKELTIGNINNDIGTWHDTDFWRRYGFILDEYPVFYRLSESQRP